MAVVSGPGLSASHGTDARLSRPREPRWHKRLREQRSGDRLLLRAIAAARRVHQHHGSALSPILRDLLMHQPNDSRNAGPPGNWHTEAVNVAFQANLAKGITALWQQQQTGLPLGTAERIDDLTAAHGTQAITLALQCRMAAAGHEPRQRAAAADELEVEHKPEEVSLPLDFRPAPITRDCPVPMPHLRSCEFQEDLSLYDRRRQTEASVHRAQALRMVSDSADPATATVAATMGPAGGGASGSKPRAQSSTFLPAATPAASQPRRYNTNSIEEGSTQGNTEPTAAAAAASTAAAPASAAAQQRQEQGRTQHEAQQLRMPSAPSAVPSWEQLRSATIKLTEGRDLQTLTTLRRELEQDLGLPYRSLKARRHEIIALEQEQVSAAVAAAPAEKEPASASALRTSAPLATTSMEATLPAPLSQRGCEQRGNFSEPGRLLYPLSPVNKTSKGTVKKKPPLD